MLARAPTLVWVMSAVGSVNRFLRNEDLRSALKLRANCVCHEMVFAFIGVGRSRASYNELLVHQPENVEIMRTEESQFTSEIQRPQF